MPRASNHESANAAARGASDQLLNLERGRAAKAVPSTDVNERVLAQAKRAGTGPWTDHPDATYANASGRTKRTT